jgi:hypothetical protein
MVSSPSSHWAEPINSHLPYRHTESGLPEVARRELPLSPTKIVEQQPPDHAWVYRVATTMLQILRA